MKVMFWGLLIAAMVGAALVTGLVRRYALQQGLLDMPNARSSHSLPTPRGGGLGMVIAFALGTAFLWWHNGADPASRPFLPTLLVAGGLVALVGFMDDRGGLSVRVRLAAHILAALLLVCAVGRPMPIELPTGPVQAAWLVYPLSVFGIVWVLNLTNFMDGIDGLAGGQAVLGCGLAAWLIFQTGGASHLAWPPALLAASAAGFLAWNFPPARIFMGDVGSGTLGLLMGGFAVWHAVELGPQWLFVWLLLLGVFVVDSTYTLIRRVMRGKNPGQAHRSHAYQQASRRLGGHLPVTLGCYGLVLLWLAPWAWAAANQAAPGWLALVVAYLPLVLMAKHFRAGELDD